MSDLRTRPDGLSDCRTCGASVVTERHRCDPSFLVWCPYFGVEVDDAKTIYARSEIAAAQQWADDFDRLSADYCFAKGSVAEIFVQPSDRPWPAMRLTVVAETRIYYTATPKAGGSK